MNDLIPVLRDLLTAVEPFRDGISHLLVRNVNDKFKALGNARDGSIVIQCSSKGDITFQGKGCLGSLRYLRQAMTTSFMSAGDIELSYGMSSNGSEEVLRSMHMTGSNGYSAFYHAVDPFVNKMNSPKQPKITSWPIGFAITKELVETFKEARRVQAQAPKTNTDFDDIFTLAYVDGKVEGIFGDKNHRLTITLAEDVEAEDGTDKVSGLFSMAYLDAIFKLVGKDSAIALLCDKALRIDTETKTAEYTFTMAAKKTRKQL